MGIDVGTGGARAIVAGADGRVVAQARQGFERASTPSRSGTIEQDPEEWWRATVDCVAGALEELRTNEGAKPEAIEALACASTSGTVLFLDGADRPLGNAIMYNDVRATDEAEEINTCAADHCERFGYRFSPSFALPKILWIKRRRRQRWVRTYRILHATDYIVGKISGDFGISDTSSALKTGCDLEACTWPDFIENELGIPLSLLPGLVLPGTPIGQVSHGCAAATGLSTKTKVHAGATDGTAALFASGAVEVGDFNSTLGSTLVVKGVAEDLVRDPEGRVYCHRHPAGYWLPGGASSTGGECLPANFAADEIAQLDIEALDRSPTSLLNYPLQRKGERLPFADPNALGFLVGKPVDRAELFTSYLEGVACVERMCFELLDSLGAKVSDRIFATGGGVNSPAWLQIRADVLNKTLLVPTVEETAFGACLLAASGSIHAGPTAATKAMVGIREQIVPRSNCVQAYEDLYGRLVAEMSRRGYVTRDA